MRCIGLSLALLFAFSPAALAQTTVPAPAVIGDPEFAASFCLFLEANATAAKSAKRTGTTPR